MKPYSINRSDKILIIKFDENVTADVFFCYCAELQKFSEQGQYDGVTLTHIYFDFSKTTWFDTLAMCYLLMFADKAKKNFNINNQFFFSSPEFSTPEIDIFLSYLSDNGFFNEMQKIGTVRNADSVHEKSYSECRKCIWPFQLFHHHEEISPTIELIKQMLRNELFGKLNSYELEYTISKAIYFLQEALDNAYKHGYAGVAKEGPCALLIKCVKSRDTANMNKANFQLQHTPYTNDSLLVEKDEFLEIYIADVGVGLRQSFLEDPDIQNAKITDEDILGYILTDGQRSKKKINPSISTRYGGLYDIMVLFRADQDRLGIKGDSRWFFDNTSIARINPNIAQHNYNDLVHGFAIVGNISWKKNIEYEFRSELLDVVNRNKELLYLKENPWMRQSYRKEVVLYDGRLTLNIDRAAGAAEATNTPQCTVLFPPQYLTKDKIINLLSNCKCQSLIIAGLHESEFRKYKMTVESLKLNIIKSTFQRIVLITNTMLPYVFIKEAPQKIVYNEKETKEYISAGWKKEIAQSFISFRLWKKVYDSELLWETLSNQNPMAYINSPVTWNNRTLRGYLDFSQLCLIPECRNLCIEQLMEFQICNYHIYFRSLDRFTDEIFEEANHRMDNSADGEIFLIGSVYVSGTSERKLDCVAHGGKNVFYFFKHSDCESGEEICTILQWATLAGRINTWFPQELHTGKEYRRVGQTSFVAVNGSNYWASRHYRNSQHSCFNRQETTYQLLQKQFGAHPVIIKMGHFDCADHHDLFEIRADSLVTADSVFSRITQDQSITSYDYLLMEFMRALISSPQRNEVNQYLNQELLPAAKATIQNKFSIYFKEYPKASAKALGLIIYLTDYQTEKIVDTLRTAFVKELRNRIVPIVPIDKNYVSSTLLLSPLLLDSLEEKINEIKRINKSDYNKEIAPVTIFIATSFTTRLQEELRHIMMCMGATSVQALSVFDRQRLPYGHYLAPNTFSYAKLDIPAIGYANMCPICEAIKNFSRLQGVLRDNILICRLTELATQWSAVKSSDNHYLNGIFINKIALPNDVMTALSRYQQIYKQGEIEIETDLALAAFAIESTVISLNSDFIEVCINSQELEREVKLLLISAHILTFTSIQLSEKFFCKLICYLIDFLDEQTCVSSYTQLAIIALCGQPFAFQEYIQNRMMQRSIACTSIKNNDALLLRLAIYHSLRMHVKAPLNYKRDLHCYLKNEQNALELIYDVFLYAEIDYKQSHRQAFGQISYTTIKMDSEIYAQAIQYLKKLESIYQQNLLDNLFHNSQFYEHQHSAILGKTNELESLFRDIKDNQDHIRAKETLANLLELVQEVNRGLYLRAGGTPDDKFISKWLSYCEDIARSRFSPGKSETNLDNVPFNNILQVISAYSQDIDTEDVDVRPWFFVHADVAEEVINLIVDMLQRRTRRIHNFVREEANIENQLYDGIINVNFKKSFVEFIFYNVAGNKKSLEEIRKIKSSKMNRPSIITFRQFENIMSDAAGQNAVPCFEWNFVEDFFPNCVQPGEHLYQAILRIPYIDMGSSFGH